MSFNSSSYYTRGTLTIFSDLVRHFRRLGAELCHFGKRLGNAKNNIKIEWQGMPSAEDAVNPAKFDQQQRLPVQGLRLHVSHHQLEPAQQNAGAKETCSRRYLLRSIARLRLFRREVHRKVRSCRAGRRWTARSRSCGNKATGATFPLLRLLRAPECASDGTLSASVIYL